MNKAAPHLILFFHITIIITLGFTVYANCINGKFIWDDYGLVKDNDYIKDWKFLPNIFKEDFGAGGGTMSIYYRPLQMFAHMAGYSLWGLSSEGYHLTSILLHIFAALALYFFIKLLYGADISFLTSLLFAVHPVNTESVCYISGLSDPLSLLFILLSSIFYVKSLNARASIFFIAAMFSFAMALLSKESAVILPALLLLYHYSVKKSPDPRKIACFFAILAAYISLRIFILGHFAPLASSPDLIQRIPGFFRAIAEYLRLLFLPFDLHVEYGDRLFKIYDPGVMAGLFLIAVVIIAASVNKKRYPVCFFSAGWFFITILPVSNIFPASNSFMMEHWLYVPAIGFFLFISSVLLQRSKDEKAAMILKALALGLVVFYSLITVNQSGNWKEPVAFYKRNLKYAPASWRFYNQLGLEYANAAMYDDAVASYKKALEINPGLPGVYSNLGLLHRRFGKADEAEAAFKRANEIDSGQALEYYKMGKALSRAQKEKDAIFYYEKTLEFAPENIGLRNDLAGSYIVAGRYQKAIALLKKTLELGPHLGLTHNNLAAAYYYNKNYDLAIEHCDKAIGLGYKVQPVLLDLLESYRK